MDTITDSGKIELSIGERQACYTMNGGARCWGADTFGHFSPPLSPPVPSVIPKDVFAFANGKVVQISVSRNYACAVTSMGDLRCWGRNSHDRSATLFHNHDTFYQSEPGFVLK